MEISVTAQLWALLYSVAVGAFLALAYDAVRISRVLFGLRLSPRMSKHEGKRLPLVGEIKSPKPKRGVVGNVFVFLGDIVFFLFSSAVFCIFVFHANYGNARWFLVFGTAAGFFVYFFTVGKIVMAFSHAIRFVLVSIFLYIRYFLALPVRLAAKYAVVPLKAKISFFLAKRRTDRAEKKLESELGFCPMG